MKALLVLVALGVAGCASESDINVLQSNNELWIDPANADDHDYVVSVRNVSGITYNPSNKQERDAIALKAMAAECPSAAIIGETVFKNGHYTTGRESLTYRIKVKC